MKVEHSASRFSEPTRLSPWFQWEQFKDTVIFRSHTVHDRKICHVKKNLDDRKSEMTVEQSVMYFQHKNITKAKDGSFMLFLQNQENRSTMGMKLLM